MRRLFSVLSLLSLLVLAQAAQAAVVQYSFSGTFSAGTGAYSSYAGQAFSGTFSYNDASVVGTSGPLTVYSTPFTLSVSTGGTTLDFGTKFLTPAALGYGSYDALGGSATNSFKTVGSAMGYSLAGNYGELTGYTLNFLTGPGAPTPNFIYEYQLMDGTVGGSGLVAKGLEGNITSYSKTPIPGALLLLGSGVAGLAALRRKFKA